MELSLTTSNFRRPIPLPRGEHAETTAPVCTAAQPPLLTLHPSSSPQQPFFLLSMSAAAYDTDTSLCYHRALRPRRPPPCLRTQMRAALSLSVAAYDKDTFLLCYHHRARRPRRSSAAVPTQMRHISIRFIVSCIRAARPRPRRLAFQCFLELAALVRPTDRPLSPPWPRWPCTADHSQYRQKSSELQNNFP